MCGCYRSPDLNARANRSVDRHDSGMRPDTVLDFWFQSDRKAWFTKDAAFDLEIRTRFLPLYELAAGGGLATWVQEPRNCLALVIALDQFPRNMFRGSARPVAAAPAPLG